MAVTASAMDAWQHGTSLAEEGRFSDAMMAFDKALKLGMQTPEVYEALAQCGLDPENPERNGVVCEGLRDFLYRCLYFISMNMFF